MVTLSDRFADLLERHVRKLRIVGAKATGCAPCHDDHTPSFSANLERGVWFCHACGRGGGVKAFAELVGEAWNKTHRETRSAKAHRAALTAARGAYERWSRAKLTELASQYRELSAEREAAETAYRLLYQRPELFTEAERQGWVAKLAAIYDRLAPVEWNLDILTYREHEETRFRWWRREAERG